MKESQQDDGPSPTLGDIWDAYANAAIDCQGLSPARIREKADRYVENLAARLRASARREETERR